MTEWVEQWICIIFCVKLERSSAETIRWFRRPQLWASGDQQLHQDNVPAHASHLVQSFLVKHQITQVTQLPCSSDLAPYDFWLFPKLKSPLRGKRFQTFDEIQENTMGHLMATGGTVWGPKVPTLEGTKVSLSHVQRFLYLVSSSITVSCIVPGWILSGQTSYFTEV